MIIATMYSEDLACGANCSETDVESLYYHVVGKLHGFFKLGTQIINTEQNK